ncbi:uncharacterized protein LOC132723366 [Ruditapes philippinarum]|uniref:uncharacterized protein LOC132723366 n=1 Tax=Ruditapes philippinarum TaxID=129788 RepID=UPI00295B620C|nr:uncharacterized protein LOC132723366 [Ruditapes philippinarum]
MARNSGLTISSKSLKLGTLLLFVGFILHVLGFSIAKWASLKLSPSSKYLSVLSSYHVGLWKYCGCIDIGLEHCKCFDRSGYPAWVHAVQAMETLGLIGLVSSGIICLILVFYRQSMALKHLNIFLILCSSVSIATGLIIFAIEYTQDFITLFKLNGSIDGKDTYEKIGASFILCAVAAGISLLACLPLFLIDLKPQRPESTNMQRPVQYSSQGHVMSVPPHQVHVIPNVSGQQPLMSSVPAYGPSSVPPQYTPQASWGCNTTYPLPQADGIPHKG